MSKYLKLFETTSQYEAYMGGGEKILPNVSLIEETNNVEYNPYIPERYIIYKATKKLNKTWSNETATFGATIKSHTFENGVGTIEFNDNVTSIGYRAFYECTNLTSITIPNSVTSIDSSAFDGCSGLASITIPNSVTSIGDNAFDRCSSLASITIPNSVTSIGEYAFNGCSSLVMIDVESGNATYDSRDNCNAIVETATNTLITGCQNTTIPNSVTSIGELAFYECSNLTSITIPNSVTSIGEYAFNGCTNLTSITIPNSVTSIGELAFNGCSSLAMIDVESGNTTYDSRDNCNAIVETATNTLITGCQNTVIPDSVTSIGDSAFDRCTNLTSITIPNSVTSIDSYAFADCTNLTSVTIPNSVTSIGDSAFQSCSNLTSVTIGNSVTSIGSLAFSGCSNLVIIDVESGNATYDSRDNCNAIIETATNTLITGCQNTTIPNSVTSINDYAFDGCTNLTSITIPNSVTSIGTAAFNGCSNLVMIDVESGNATYDSRDNCNAIVETATNTLIIGIQNTTIPNSVTSIGDSAFLNCSSLTSITIPNSVTSIDEYAFYNCISLKSVTVESTTPPSLGSRTFYSNADGRKIYVPSASVNTYKAASGWSTYANDIEAIQTA